MLRLFVAFLQAFIFTFLTTLFIGMSWCCTTTITAEHGEHAGTGTKRQPRIRTCSAGLLVRR